MAVLLPFDGDKFGELHRKYSDSPGEVLNFDNLFIIGLSILAHFIHGSNSNNFFKTNKNDNFIRF